MKRRDILAGGASLLIGLMAGQKSVDAQAWPARAITIIVAVGPGSSADAIARGLARRELGVPVHSRRNEEIVESRHIVDRSFAAAELRLGDNGSERRVRIVRTDGRPAW
jgi:hypothetical protein